MTRPRPAASTSTAWSPASTWRSSSNTKNKDAALKFVKFMTSDAEQTILNKTYGSLPSVQTAPTPTRRSRPPSMKIFQDMLATTAAPLPAGARGEPVRDPGRHRDEGAVRRRGQRQADHRGAVKAKLTAGNQQIKAAAEPDAPGRTSHAAARAAATDDRARTPPMATVTTTAAGRPAAPHRRAVGAPRRRRRPRRPAAASPCRTCCCSRRSCWNCRSTSSRWSSASG